MGLEIPVTCAGEPSPVLTWTRFEINIPMVCDKRRPKFTLKGLNASAQKAVIFFHLKQLQDIVPGPWEYFVIFCVKYCIPRWMWRDCITVL